MRPIPRALCASGYLGILTRLIICTQEWWHWGTATVPIKGVYGTVTPIELSEPYASPVSSSITLGTDNAVKHHLRSYS